MCVRACVRACVRVCGGAVAWWLGRRIWNRKVPSSSPGQEQNKKIKIYIKKATALCPWTRHFTPIVSVHTAVQVGTWLTLGKVKAAVQRWQGLHGPELLWDTP